MAKITVVIPCYNASGYLLECVTHLKKQTYSNFETIFIDDCSTDNTWEILKTIKDTTSLNVKVLRNDTNSGPGVSRNKGILCAQSEYITFCDSDDWFEPSFLEKMLALIESTNSDIVFSGYKVVDEKGKISERPISFKTGELTRKEVFCLDADSLCMLMVKTSIMKETLLPDLRNGEDVATVPLLMVKAKKFAVTKECLYNYFRRIGSASQMPSMRVVDSLVNSYKYLQNKFPSEYKLELEYLGVKNMLYGALISLFTFSYDTNKASEIIDDFESSYPFWSHNPYINGLSRNKRIVVRLLSKRRFLLVKVIAFIRYILVKYL